MILLPIPSPPTPTHTHQHLNTDRTNSQLIHTNQLCSVELDSGFGRCGMAEVIGESDRPNSGRRSATSGSSTVFAAPAISKKPSYSQFPIPPGGKGWTKPVSPPRPIQRRRTMDNSANGRTHVNGTGVNGHAANGYTMNGKGVGGNGIGGDGVGGGSGRVSQYTLSVAAEFSLKRANRQLLAMGETLENAKSEFSPTKGIVPAPWRSHSRSSSAPLSPNAQRTAEYGQNGDMLGDMRKLAAELRTLRESIDPARRGSLSSVGSTSRGSTPLTSPRTNSRLREDGVETPRTSPRHSRQNSSGLRGIREEAPVIEVQTMRGGGAGQPAAVVRIYRSQPRPPTK